MNAWTRKRVLLIIMALGTLPALVGLLLLAEACGFLSRNDETPMTTQSFEQRIHALEKTMVIHHNSNRDSEAEETLNWYVNLKKRIQKLEDIHAQ